MARFKTSILAPLAFSLACYDQRPAVTFDEFKAEMEAAGARANASRATLSAVGSDIRFGAEGRWALVAVPTAGFSRASAIEQGLTAGEANAIAEGQNASRSARVVYLSNGGVSSLELAKGLVKVPIQRVVTGEGVSWLSFTLEIRGDEAPELSVFRSSKTPP